MRPSHRSAHAVWVLAALALAVSGCQKDKHVIPATTPTPTASASASASSSASASASASPSPGPTISAGSIYAQTTLTIATAGGNTILSSGGFSGTFYYPNNNSNGSDAGSLVVDSNAPVSVPSPAPTGSPLLYYLFMSSTDITFTSAVGISSLTLPSGMSPAGIGFTETLYDSGAGSQIGSPVNGTVSGQTVSFGSLNSASFSASGGDGYLMVISTTASSSTEAARTRIP